MLIRVFAGKLIEKFYDATVLAAISNTDYEGQVKLAFEKPCELLETP